MKYWWQKWAYRVVLAVLLAAISALIPAGTVRADSGTLHEHMWWGNVPIQDNGGWDGRAVWPVELSGAPSDARITSVDVKYTIQHTYVGDLKVWLTTERNGTWYDKLLWDREGGSGDDIEEHETGLTDWDGLDPNGTWYLMVADYAAEDVGEIDSWEIWVHWSTQTFSVYSISFSGHDDPDGDGYYSAVTVTWDADVSFGSASITAKIYVDAGYLSAEKYLGSVGPYTITGNSSNDKRSFSIPTDQLQRDNFQITVKLYRDSTKVVEEDSDWIKLEPPSQEIQTFSVYSISFSGHDDPDGDGYYSAVTVTWDADVSFGSASITAKIYVDAGYLSAEKYLGSVGPYTITGNSSNDKRSFSIPTDQLQRDNFQITVKLYRDSTKVAEEDSDWIKLEPPSQEIQAFTITDVYIVTDSNSDPDSDGYISRFEVKWKSKVNYGSSQVYAKFFVDTTSPDETEVIRSSTYTVTSGEQWQSMHIECTQSELEHGSHDFRIRLYRADNDQEVASRKESDDNDLLDVKTELVSEEIQAFTIPSIWFTGHSDPDQDSYYSEVTVHWDANVSFGSADITAEIYADAGALSSEQYLGTVGPYTITGDSSSDTRSLPIPTNQLDRDDYQITVKIYRGSTKVAEEDSDWIKLEPPSQEFILIDISGTIRYEDREFNTSGYTGNTWKPIRFTTVELLDSSNNVLDVSNTNASGDYSFSGISVPSGEQLRIRIKAETEAGEVHNNWLGGIAGSIYEHISEFIMINASATYALDDDIQISENAAAWNILDMLVVGYQFALSWMSEDSEREDLKAVDAIWEPGDFDGVGYKPSNQNIYIGLSNGFDAGFHDHDILHEYGHHVNKCASTLDWWWPWDLAHSWDLPAPGGTEMAWSEAFASFFSMTATANSPSAVSAIGVPSGTFVRPYAVGFSDVWDLEYGSSSPRSDVEGAVAGVLWDLYDIVADTGDTYNNMDGRTKFFALFDDDLDGWTWHGVPDAPDISNLRMVWLTRYGDQELIDPIFLHHVPDILSQTSTRFDGDFFVDKTAKIGIPILLEAELEKDNWPLYNGIEGETVHFDIYYSGSWHEIHDDGITETSFESDEEGIASVYYMSPKSLSPDDYAIRVRYDGSDTYDACTLSRTMTIKKPNWLVMVYLCADNDLEVASIQDFYDEMWQARSNDEVSICVLYDRTSLDQNDGQGYSDAEGDWSTTRYYTFCSDARIYNDWGEQNMGSQATLQTFVDTAMGHCSAENVALILWNHGSGWKIGEIDQEPLTDSSIRDLRQEAVLPQMLTQERVEESSSKGFKAVCIDYYNGDVLRLHEIRGVLDSITDGGANPIDLLGYDACVMGMLEVAYDAFPYASFLVASEDNETIDGWEYHRILGTNAIDSSTTPKQWGQKIVDESIQATLGCWDLSYVSNRFDEVAYMAERLTEFFTDNEIHATVARTASRKFQAYSSGPECYIDLRQFAAELAGRVGDAALQSAAQAVANGLADISWRVAWNSTHTDSTTLGGLSIYFPEDTWDSGDYTNYFTPGDLQFTSDPSQYWDEFLIRYLTTISPPTVTNDGGAIVTSNSARLRGEVTDTGGENPTVYIYWGDNDGGTNPASWDHQEDLGTRGAGLFDTDISGLNPGTNYYYRCYAENLADSDWANSTESFNTSDEVVSFPDSNLEAAIRAAIGKPTGDIYRSDLEGLTMLNASIKGISDLTGLECCIDLEFLLLGDNQISDISPLAGLTSLWFLNLTSNQISNISPLAGLTNLQQLELSGNQITDLSPLAGLINLQTLYLDSNQINDISPLVANTGLSAGDFVSLLDNQLSADSLSMYIPQLEARGVTVLYDQPPNTLPEVTNVTASQGSPIVDINYDVSDAEQSEVIISFEYWDGAGWQACITTTGEGTQGTGTGKSGTWNAKTEFDEHYMTDCRIRVTADDGQAENNIGSAESSTFTLDTKDPTGCGCNAPADGAAGVSVTPDLICLTASDDSPLISYHFQLAENDTFNLDLQESGWQSSTTWSPSTLDYNKQYFWRMKAKDSYGNDTDHGSTFNFTTISPPMVTNDGGAIDVTSNSARLRGEVTDTGGENPTVYIYWGDNDGGTNPASWDHQEDLGTREAGPFDTDISSLNPGTNYYHRCYAENSAGSDWANSTESFTTEVEPAEPPIVKTRRPGNVTPTSVLLRGKLTNLGSASSVQVSFEWGLTKAYGNETIPPQTMNAPGNFSFELTDLSPGTTIHYRAKAVGDDISYGNHKKCTPGTPDVRTQKPDNITSDSARLKGKLIDLGTASEVQVSFEWGLTKAYGNETIPPQTMDAPGKFYNLAGSLFPGTKYYYRAKGVGDGTGYGPRRNFTTLPEGVPILKTSKASRITSSSARLKGELTDLGTASEVQVSFEWGTTNAYGNETPPQTMDAPGKFYFDLTDLPPGITIHYRAKGVGNGTNYGKDKSFTTQ